MRDNGERAQVEALRSARRSLAALRNLMGVVVVSTILSWLVIMILIAKLVEFWYIDLRLVKGRLDVIENKIERQERIGGDGR